jgi:hypothetical protein
MKIKQHPMKTKFQYPEKKCFDARLLAAKQSTSDFTRAAFDQ